MRVSVKALPVHDIIEDLGVTWDQEIARDGGELTLNLPEGLGEGYIRGTNFDSGIGIIEYNCKFFEDVEILFTLNVTHPLKFIFCSQGTVDHTFVEDSDMHTVNTFQNVIVSSSGNNGHLLNFKAGKRTRITSIEIIREIFSHRDNHHFENLDPLLTKLFQDSVAEKKFFYQGNYSIRAADIVDEIAKKENSGFLRSLFLQGKVYEMLVLQIAQFQDDQQEDKAPEIMRRSDVEKVKKAKEMITANLDQNYSVDYLAKEVGTNINKLQEGFKYMFDLTVNKYIQQVKLDAAKDLLRNTDHNISEVVNLIGLNNRSYFSKVFKGRYGVSPNYFLKARNDKEEE